MIINPYAYGTPSGAWVTTATLSGSGNSSGWNGYTLRQVIPAGAFAAGSRVRLRLVSGDTVGVIIGAAYFGKKAVAGSYNFDGSPTQVLFGGNPGVTISAGGDVYTDEIVAPITAGPHILSCYFSGATTLRTSAPAAGWFPYYKSGNDAASVEATGYTSPAAEGYSWLVMRVEVWQP